MRNSTDIGGEITRWAQWCGALCLAIAVGSWLGVAFLDGPQTASASPEAHASPRALEAPLPQAVDVLRADPALDAIVPAEPTLEKLADGFLFTEGPVWLPEGALLFSDPNANRIYRWSEANGLSVFRDESGYDGADIDLYTQPGSNGLTLDALGRLVICEHGNRRVTRLETGGALTVLADRFDGNRFNSPNDLVSRSDGTIYFSDLRSACPSFTTIRDESCA